MEGATGAATVAGPTAAPGRRSRRLLPLLVALCASCAVLAQLWQLRGAQSDDLGVSVGRLAPHLGRLEAGGARLGGNGAQFRFAHQFATKTAYWEQKAGRSVARELAGGLNQRVFRPDLQLVQTQIVARHGVRFPTAGNIEEIEQLLEKLQPYADKLPGWLQNYSLPYNLSVQGALAEQGKQEMRSMAARTLIATGHQAPVKFSDKFRLAHTTVRRTAESAVA